MNLQPAWTMRKREKSLSGIGPRSQEVARTYSLPRRGTKEKNPSWESHLNGPVNNY